MPLSREVNMFNRMVERYGTPIIIKRKGKEPVRRKAVVQPYLTNFRRKFGGDEQLRPSGIDDGYDLVAHLPAQPNDTPVLYADVVEYQGERYRVISTGAREFRGMLIYFYAVLRKIVEIEGDYYGHSIE